MFVGRKWCPNSGTESPKLLWIILQITCQYQPLKIHRSLSLTCFLLKAFLSRRTFSAWPVTWKLYLFSRVRGGSRAGEKGPAEGGGEGDRYCFLSGLQLVAGRTPTHPDCQRPELGEHTQTADSQWFLITCQVSLAYNITFIICNSNSSGCSGKTSSGTCGSFQFHCFMNLHVVAEAFPPFQEWLVWHISFPFNSPGNWDITFQHICVMEGLLPLGEGWLQLHIHLHHRWTLHTLCLNVHNVLQ